MRAALKCGNGVVVAELHSPPSAQPAKANCPNTSNSIRHYFLKCLRSESSKVCVHAQTGETLKLWFSPNLGMSRSFQRVLEWIQGGTWEGFLKCHCRLDSGSVKVSCPNSRLMPRHFVVSFTFVFFYSWCPHIHTDGPMMSSCPQYCPHGCSHTPTDVPMMSPCP